MDRNRAAIRYAKAVLEYALEGQAAGAVEADMLNMATTIAQSGELQRVLTSPVIKTEAKKNALLEIFRDAHEISKGLVRTLLENKRIGLLEEVALKYVALYRTRKGEETAQVTTAVPLSGELQEKILDAVAKATGKKVALENHIDEKILGGFVLRIGDTQYDASIASKLNAIKREFTNSL